MIIKNLFNKDINRNINGVINAGDTDRLQIQNELEEYVITQDIANKIERILDAYFEHTNNANGVWISAYYGSGKSHLLKMLSVLLENKQITENKSAVDYFLEKCQSYSETLKGRIRALGNIPSQSILFNIDHLANHINRNQEQSVLAVFVKAFNRLCGYADEPYIAQFERELDEIGQFSNFKNIILQLTQKNWDIVKSRTTIYSNKISQAFNQVTNQHIEGNVLRKYQDNIQNLSIENFATQVREYITQKGPNFRVNFFIDEAGQYIHGNPSLMLSLQSIAECLNKECRGRSWVFATAQSNLEETLGAQHTINNEEAGKIRDRFSVRIGLTSRDIAEVIKKRLLEKTEQAKNDLSDLYDREYHNFDVLFNFEDTQQYLRFTDKQDFISIYPFIPYQLNLLQNGIRQLADHEAFQESVYSAGERSLLVILQEVIKKIQNEHINQLAVIDMMFDVLSSALKPNFLQPITDADTNLSDPFLMRVLKALALVKYNTDFKANIHNITVLLYSNFTENLEELTKKVATALNRLEQEHYIERVEDKYSYLTNKEKDIESEIHRIEISQESIANKLKEMIFDSVLGQNRIQYSNGKYFFFNIKIDDIRFTTRDYPLTVSILIQMQNGSRLEDYSFGKTNELVAYINDTDNNLFRDLALILQTNEYTRKNSAADPSMQSILLEKQTQNSRREESVKNQLRNILSTMEYYTNGSKIESTATDPIKRFQDALYTIIEGTYTSIGLVAGQIYKEDDIPHYFNGQEIMADTPATPAETEILNFIRNRTRQAYTTSVTDVTDNFENPPYGWPLVAIRCIIAQLCAKHKLEAVESTNILEARELYGALINSRHSGSVLLRSQTELNPTQINNLKQFYSDCFSIQPTETNDGKEVAQQVQNKIRDEINRLSQEYSQMQNYPFADYFNQALTILQEHNRTDYNYYYQEEFAFSKNALIEIYHTNIIPLRTFLPNAFNSIYSEAKRYLSTNSANLRELDTDIPSQIKDILNDKDCFKGSNMPKLNQLLSQLRRLVDEKVSQIKQDKLAETEALEARVKSMPDFANASESKRTDVAIAFQQLKNKIKEEPQIGLIRDKVEQFMQTQYPNLLAALTATEQTPAKPILSLRKLTINYNNLLITNEQELNDYLTCLKQAINAALKDHNIDVKL